MSLAASLEEVGKRILDTKETIETQFKILKDVSITKTIDFETRKILNPDTNRPLGEPLFSDELIKYAKEALEQTKAEKERIRLSNERTTAAYFSELQKEIGNVKLKFQEKAAFLTDGPRFLKHFNSTFGEIIHVDRITKSIMAVFTHQGYVELWSCEHLDEKDWTIIFKEFIALPRQSTLTSACKVYRNEEYTINSSNAPLGQPETGVGAAGTANAPEAATEVLEKPEPDSVTYGYFLGYASGEASILQLTSKKGRAPWAISDHTIVGLTQGLEVLWKCKEENLMNVVTGPGAIGAVSTTAVAGAPGTEGKEEIIQRRRNSVLLPTMILNRKIAGADNGPVAQIFCDERTKRIIVALKTGAVVQLSLQNAPNPHPHSASAHGRANANISAEKSKPGSARASTAMTEMSTSSSGDGVNTSTAPAEPDFEVVDDEERDDVWDLKVTKVGEMFTKSEGGEYSRAGTANASRVPSRQGRDPNRKPITCMIPYFDPITKKSCLLACHTPGILTSYVIEGNGTLQTSPLSFHLYGRREESSANNPTLAVMGAAPPGSAFVRGAGAGAGAGAALGTPASHSWATVAATDQENVDYLIVFGAKGKLHVFDTHKPDPMAEIQLLCTSKSISASSSSSSSSVATTTNTATSGSNSSVASTGGTDGPSPGSGSTGTTGSSTQPTTTPEAYPYRPLVIPLEDDHWVAVCLGSQWSLLQVVKPKKREG
ncbi:hypothetical protein HK102_011582 [Quaeritorhiza haematococci]|nr:hypothetical protein HK102_011582 [Quaeritorhiza haematococci]